jgi:hypothetical protein
MVVGSEPFFSSKPFFTSLQPEKTQKLNPKNRTPNKLFIGTFFTSLQPEKTPKLNPKTQTPNKLLITLDYKLLIIGRYTGSLTVPPCTGNAPVFVLDGFAHASRGQIEALRAAFGGNARAVQPAYGRRPREYRAAADAKVPVPLEK